MTFDELAAELGKLHDDALFEKREGVMPPRAEAFFLLALATLQQAQQYVRLAEFHRMGGE